MRLCRPFSALNWPRQVSLETIPLSKSDVYTAEGHHGRNLGLDRGNRSSIIEPIIGQPHMKQMFHQSTQPFELTAAVAPGLRPYFKRIVGHPESRSETSPNSCSVPPSHPHMSFNDSLSGIVSPSVVDEIAQDLSTMYVVCPGRKYQAPRRS